MIISTAVAVMLKLSVPLVTDFAHSEVPSIWSLVAFWLRPPYLYLVINCIIITIVASSKLRITTFTVNASEEMQLDARVSEKKGELTVNALEATDDFVISKSSWNALDKDPMELSKPPLSARFSHRKVVKTTSEGGKTLRVSKPKRWRRRPSNAINKAPDEEILGNSRRPQPSQRRGRR